MEVVNEYALVFQIPKNLSKIHSQQGLGVLGMNDRYDNLDSFKK